MSELIEEMACTPHAHEIKNVFIGLDNTCTTRKVHILIDCDEKRLSKLFDYGSYLIKRFNTSNLYFVLSSPWRWQILGFSKHSREEYEKMLDVGIEMGAVDSGYVYNIKRKGYAVCRIGAKYDVIVPKVEYVMKGNSWIQECQECKETFFNAYEMMEELNSFV